MYYNIRYMYFICLFKLDNFLCSRCL